MQVTAGASRCYLRTSSRVPTTNKHKRRGSRTTKANVTGDFGAGRDGPSFDYMKDHLIALPSGYRLQEYELLRVLGVGGFGITYLGFDHNLDKGVAIKEYLPRDLATRTNGHTVVAQSSAEKADFDWGLERFLEEARMLARFDQRNVIRVFRFFQAHGTGYIVMEYAEGETFSELLGRKNKLSEAELKRILLPILDGLEEVHRRTYLHRDIKPGNIVIRADGSPVLLDFGAARHAVGVKSRSVTSIVTPGYAPIEQYSTRGNQGPWTDIYALAAVCYRALTGELPIDATDRIRRDPLVPARTAGAGAASSAFLDSIDWALAVDEERRPQTVAEWRQALLGKARSPEVASDEKQPSVVEPASAAAKPRQPSRDADVPVLRDVVEPLSPAEMERAEKRFKQRSVIVAAVAAVVATAVIVFFVLGMIDAVSAESLAPCAEVAACVRATTAGEAP